ncbi:glycosyl transferase group 1 [Emticicia oligotrophica DSM 17448]|uniref:Glycosyl transferase group 1 n=1 Tax=Emticicia oligotrophica (strain DSM 17448 / CIP 109782 / MTCC 6937 / GPTSA100-15) TaxID=929562 RepID=A0ABN4ATH7_EMTOG|nr:glycosyltransferase family 1 protein [Emticicia oligotrophica]AFK04962.1 glycosyl transferase group 1 [Emticicia oligotrophica DSM 17448]
MIIGIEAQRIFRPKKHGMDIYALELIRAIHKIDKENQYVVFVKPDTDICLKSSDNLKVVEVEGKTYVDWEQVSLPKAIEQEKIDLMHFTSNTASVKISCPFVLTLHDIIYLEKFLSQGSLYQIAGHFYRRWNVPKIAPKAKFIFTVSEFEKIQIQKALGVNFDRIQVVYNAYNQQFRVIDEQQELDKVRVKYSLPQEFIFFLGNQAPKKNMKRVLEAYAQYVDSTENPIKLVVAESSQTDLMNLLNEINRKDLSSNIILTGYVKHAELPFIYNLAKLFLYPSLRESFGIPIIEAMACGTPVITSNTSAMPEVADDAAVLINPMDTSSITQAIRKVLGSDSLYNDLKNKGLNRAKAFSWESTAEKTINFYRAVLNSESIKSL